MKSVEWGNEIYLKDLFIIKRGKRLTVENRIKGNRPLVTAGYENTGVAEFIGNENQEIFPKDTITIDMFANTFYRNYDYSADDNILVLFDKEIIPSNAKLFIVNLINKVLSSGFSYGKQYRMGSFNQTRIQLPMKHGKIDFEFMESFITQIEAERIEKLEAYLEASGLKDYVLTDEEQKVLDDFESDNIKLEEFQINTLFEVSPSKAYKLNDANILIENGKTPYVSNQSQDNGYIGWSNLSALNPSNVITLSDTWQSERTIFYQPTNFIGKSHLQVMKAFDKRFQKLELFFVISSFRKAITELNYDYGTKFNRTKINATKIQLPTKNKQPNYKIMQTFISAIQKLVIKDVVLYVDEKVGV